MSSPDTSTMLDNQTVFLNATEVAMISDDAALLVNDSEVSSIPLTIAAAKLTAYKVAIATHVYVLPVIVFAGLIGNTLSLLIMLKPHNRRISCCNYLAGLSVSDNLMLLNALNYWTISFKDRPATNTECNIMAWLFQAVSFTSIVFIFSMTVDRFLAIRFPFKARRLCTPYRARVAIACIAFVVPLYTLPYFFTSQLFPGRTCVAVATTNALAGAYNWVNIFLGSIVPFVGLLTMNAFIILTVRRRADLSESTNSAQKEEKAISSGTDNPAFVKDSSIQSTKRIPTNEDDDSAQTDHEQTKPSNAPTLKPDVQPEAKQQNINTGSKTSNKNKFEKRFQSCKKRSSVKQSSDNQLTIMLLLVTFTFLLLTLPQYARYLVAVLWNYRVSAEDYANFLLLAHVSNRFYYANSACNFFLYCISGNKFRQDVKALFTTAK